MTVGAGEIEDVLGIHEEQKRKKRWVSEPLKGKGKCFCLARLRDPTFRYFTLFTRARAPLAPRYLPYGRALVGAHRFDSVLVPYQVVEIIAFFLSQL